MMIDARVPEYFAQVLDELESQMQSSFKALSRLNKPQLAVLASQIDFYQDLVELGFEDRVNEFMASYNDIIADALDLAKREGVTGIVAQSFSDIEAIKAADLKYLLGKGEDYSNLLERNLITGYALGLSSNEIAERLSNVPLRDYQINASLNTFYADAARIASAKVYNEVPDARFKYIGHGRTEHPSKICAWLIEHQDPEGYTKAEIDGGIKTPFGVVNWSGRIPNFNCTHEWIKINE